jgi:hypothetical protein
MADIIKLAERDYRWLLEVVYKDAAGAVHVATKVSTANGHGADPYRYRLALEAFYRLRGFEIVSFQVKALPAAGQYGLVPGS